MSIFDGWELEHVENALSMYHLKFRDMEDKACIKPAKRIIYLNLEFGDLEESIMHELGHHREYEEGWKGRYAHHEIESDAIEFLMEHPEVKEYLTEYIESQR